MLLMILSWVLHMGVVVLSWYTLRHGNVELRLQLNIDWMLGLLYAWTFVAAVAETNNAARRKATG